MRTDVRSWAGPLLLVGCAETADPEDASGPDASASSTADSTSSASTMASDPGTDATGTTGSVTTTSPSTSVSTTMPGESSSGIVPHDFPVLPPKFCDLASVDPTADPETVIDAGDGPGQIPTVIGEVMLRNCGCHFTDNVVGYVDYTTNETPLDTHAAFHETFTGIFPSEFKGMPVYLAVEQRVVFNNPLPMPSIECDVEGELGTITEADRETMALWLAAGAPDGANYPPE